MGHIIGVTGSPGTGKKTLAPLVAARLGLPCLSVEELARNSHDPMLLLAPDGEVDTSALKKKLAKNPPRPSLVYGHLLPYVMPPSLVAHVVVLRCEPSRLKMRLLERGYEFRKVRENVEAELIGVVSSDSSRAFGERHMSEYDTTDSDPRAASMAISRILRRPKKTGKPIDWTLGYDSASKLSLLLSAGKSASALT